VICDQGNGVGNLEILDLMGKRYSQVKSLEVLK